MESDYHSDGLEIGTVKSKSCFFCIVALAFHSQSPAAYQALKFYIDSNLESAGYSMERLQDSRRQYVALRKSNFMKRTKRKVRLLSDHRI